MDMAGSVGTSHVDTGEPRSPVCTWASAVGTRKRPRPLSPSFDWSFHRIDDTQIDRRKSR